MRRRVVGVHLLAALLASPGCSAFRLGQGPATPEQVERRRQLSAQAQSAIDARDMASAESLLDQLITEAPKLAEAHHRLARVYALEDRIGEAEQAEDRALKIDPDYVDALIGQGEIRLRGGQYREALEPLDLAIDIDPRRAAAHLARAQAMEAAGRVDEALAAYFRALEIDPNASTALLRVATIQLDRDQADQALARLASVLERAPEDPEARYQRGRAYLALQQVPEAIGDLAFAANKLPARSDVHYHLALAYHADRKQADALKSAEKALRLAPESPLVRGLTERLRR